MAARRTLKSRLNSLSARDIETGCVIWLGCRDKNGYGKITAQEYPKDTLAHRVAYKFWCGEIPDGLELDHLCKNRSCINHEHLEPVTRQENICRADYKSNHRNGRKTHCKNGHEFSAETTILEIYGNRFQRKCSVCRKILRRERTERDRVYRIKAKMMAAQGMPITEVKA